jgi:hypothetical protein
MIISYPRTQLYLTNTRKIKFKIVKNKQSYKIN